MAVAVVTVLASTALADDAYDRKVRDKAFEVLNACNKGYDLIGLEVEFCQNYRYLMQRSVRHGTPDELADTNEVIEYMISKWFLYECIRNAPPGKDRDCSLPDAQARAKKAAVVP